MRTKIFFLIEAIALGLLTLSSPAQAEHRTHPQNTPISQVSPQDADEATRVINAQVAVTHDRVQGLLNQIGQISGDPYPDAKYAALAADFKTKVGYALARYDNDMTNSILPKAKYWLARYADSVAQDGGNATFDSDTKGTIQRNLNLLGEEEVTQVIVNLYTEALGDFPVAADDGYENAAHEKYCKANLQQNGFNGNDLSTVERIVIYASGKEQDLSQTSTCVYSDDFARWNYACDENHLCFHWVDEEYSDALQNPGQDGAILAVLAKPAFAPTCDTTTCRQLRYADVLQFLTLVSDQIDREIDLGNGLILPKSSLDVTKLKAAMKSVLHP